mgnify:CR=1 FL=1
MLIGCFAFFGRGSEIPSDVPWAVLDPLVEVVAVDEVQFLDEPIVALLERLADRGVRVIAAGLDQDFAGSPFGVMPALLAKAEYVSKLQAICMVCGGPANRTQRLVASNDRVLVGASEAYEARCRHCFDPTLGQRPE